MRAPHLHSNIRTLLPLRGSSMVRTSSDPLLQRRQRSFGISLPAGLLLLSIVALRRHRVANHACIIALAAYPRRPQPCHDRTPFTFWPIASAMTCLGRPTSAPLQAVSISFVRTCEAHVWLKARPAVCLEARPRRPSLTALPSRPSVPEIISQMVGAVLHDAKGRVPDGV